MSKTDDASAANAAKVTIESEPAEDAFDEGYEAEPKAAAAEEPAEEPGLGAEAVGFIKGFGMAAWKWASKHPNTAGGAVAGFVTAALILLIGLWNTIILAAFVLVGALMGQIRDGDNSLVNFFAHLLDRQDQ